MRALGNRVLTLNNNVPDSFKLVLPAYTREEAKRLL